MAPASPGMVRRIDTRQAITMRGLLEWAYQREMVRFAGADDGGRPTLAGLGGGTGRVCDVLGDGFTLSDGNGWRGAPSAHPDAEWLHMRVQRLEREDYWRVVRAAESGTPPEWDPEVPALKVVRLLKASGQPRMYVCPVARRPVAERIAVVGVGEAEAAMIRAAARETWRRWVAMLAVLRDQILAEPRALKRWQVTAIGAELEPWRAK